MANGIANLAKAGVGFGELPIFRQLTIMLMVAGTIALGVMVALWARDPGMVPLYAYLEPKEAHEVLEALQKTNIQHSYDAAVGVMVPIDKVNEVRMHMAAQGLPKSAGSGYEILDRPQGFGTSQFMETVKYKRSIEGELAKTITGLDAVRTARVHLGLPRQTTFLKNQTASSASVMVELYGGQKLTAAQINGIVHLVSSSVSGLKEDDITIIDQSGNMLNNRGSKYMLMAVEEANYVQQKEADYSRKILDLLEPIYGQGDVRAEVSALFDFTLVEQTKELYDSNKPKLRSEATINEKRTGDGLPEGIPGALSNQPPGATSVPETTAAADTTTEEGAPAIPVVKPANYRDQATKNYELDKTIVHERQTVGELQKLSVAVVINNRINGYDEKGVATRTPLTPEELTAIDGIIKDAIGFNAERGDVVRVLNSAFVVAPPYTEPPKTMLDLPKQLLNQPLVMSLIKHTVGAIFLLLLVFSILKPMVKILSEYKPQIVVKNDTEEETKKAKVQLDLPPIDMVSQQRVEHVKQVAHSDTKKAAQVVMNWVGKEDE